MNKILPIVLGLGLFCCFNSEVIAQERLPLLPDLLPLPQPQPPEITPPSPPSDTPLEINPFRIPSGIDPQQDLSTIITPKRFNFRGNTIFTDEKLQAIVAEYIGQPITVADLFQIEQKLTALYVDQGYINSGAFIANTREAIDPTNAEITIQIVEGRISEIEITGGKRLQKYIRARVQPTTQKVLREQDIQEAFRWLQIDPLITGINAQLKPGVNAGQAVLALTVETAKPLAVEVFANNNRAPSVGTFERGATAAYRNVTGLGDTFTLNYRNSPGSNLIGGSYTVPVNIQNGTIGVNFIYGNNSITEEPFNQIDLKTNAIQAELSFRQPILRKISSEQIQEIALGASISRLESNESLLSIPFPLTEGADGEGQTDSTALRLFQEFSNRDRNDSIILRSQLNIGVPIATRNADLFGNGTFLTVQAQALWAHQFDRLIWVNRGGVQFADGPVIPSEQFSLGGVSTVRGYRQDGVTRDSGLFFSSELRVPVFSGSAGSLQIVPFVDAGHAFSQSQRFIPDESQTLVSVGLGLRYDLNDRLAVRLDYGIPLLNRPDRRPALQEEGLYLSISWRF
jgi:hemolysin activation/secretion protein